ncbi:hypothetical protein F4810DRAFT_382613 [Camillea tinctor]|nr:hypothetical protein F4810DRAFT_382613 [Camillea tinctor]
MDNQEKTRMHRDSKRQREDVSVSSTDTSRSDAIQVLHQPLQQKFHQFLNLPLELRTMVYQMATWAFGRPIRTVGTVQGHENTEWTLVVKTIETPCYPGSLWQVSFEARAEVRRLCIELPTHLIADIGANVININEGLRLRRMTSNYVGERPYHEETTFFMNEPTVIEVFQLIHRNELWPETLDWLRNVMLDRRAFQCVLGGYHNFSDDRRGGPFINLPSLKKIVVGVMHHSQDIALLEGRYDDVLTEVQIAENPEPKDEQSRWVVQSPYKLHPVIELMILTAVHQTRADVGALEEAGIRVVWGIIRGGITRRPDIFEWSLDD